MKKTLILFAGILFLFSCGGPKMITTPSDSDVNRGVEKYPGLTIDELNKGHAEFLAKCTQCHGSKNPQKHSAEEWNGIVDEMAGKASRKADKQKIEGESMELIKKYLAVMSGSK